MVKKSNEFVPCKSYQIRNASNRCINVEKPKSSKKRISPSLKVSKSKISKSKSPKKEKIKKVLKDCGVGRIRSPESNRCIDEERYKKQKAKLSSPKASNFSKVSKSGDEKKKEPKEKIKLSKEGFDFENANLGTKWKEPKTLPSCITRSQKKLKDLQVKVALYMQTHDSLLVVHGTGCGKTLTAITVSQCYLDSKPENKVIFLGPASLTSNFKKEMGAYGVKDFKKYEFYSFDKFYRLYREGNPVNCKNSLLIIDEAHNLKNPRSGRSKAAVLASKEADKRLLLTATPFIASLLNFGPIINMLYGKSIISINKEEAQTSLGKEISPINLAKLNYYLYDKVHFVNCINKEDFPEKIEHTLKIQMTDEYYEKYIKALDNTNEDIFVGNPMPFYNGERRAVNRLGIEYFSQKMDKIIPIIRGTKSILYTNWLSFGAKPIEKILNKEKIKYRIFSGETPKKERQQIVDDFNDNKFEVLICTRAAGEGIDLKEVQNVVILEPPWDQAALDQVVGRAIRYKSHVNLSIEKRKVHIYYLSLEFSKKIKDEAEKYGNTNHKSGDEVLYNIIEKKKQAMNIVINNLKEISI